ncbi:hypothetical protein, partial [Halobellus rarus]
LTGVTNTETNTISSTLTSGTINADISGTEDPPETTLTIEGNGFGTRTDSQTFSNVGDGHSDSISVEGSLSTDPVADGATVTLTGQTNEGTQQTVSGSASDGDSRSITVHGNADPIGSEVSASGFRNTVQYDIPYGDGPAFQSSASKGETRSYTMDTGDVETVEEVEFRGSSYYLSEGVDIEVQVDGVSFGTKTWPEDSVRTKTFTAGSVDVGDTAEITLVKQSDHGAFKQDYDSESYTKLISGKPSSITIATDTGGSASLGSGGTESIALSDDTSTLDVSHAGSGYVDYELQFTERTQTADPAITLNGESQSYNGQLGDGETATLSFAPSSLDSGSNAVSLGMASVSSDAPAMTADYSIEVEEVDGALDPSVDIDEDGTPEVSHSGLLTSGQTESATIDPTLSDDSWSVSGSGSPVTVSADITEATVTSDPAVELNG